MKSEELLEDLGFQIISGSWYDREHEKNTLKRLCHGKPFASDCFEHSYNLTAELCLLRSSLTPEEITRYQHGGMIVSQIIEETAASVRPGETEWAVAARAAGRAWEEGIEPLSVFCSSDERICNYRHAISTGKIIRERVQLGCNMKYKGLVIGCTRFINLKKTDSTFRKQYEDTVKISCKMIADTQPGLPYTFPLLSGKALYEELGYKNEFEKHHQGGSIGYQARDCRVDFNCKEIIAENQAFCWNPTITGTKSEDTIIASNREPLFITRPVLFPSIVITEGSKTFIRASILEKY